MSLLDRWRRELDDLRALGRDRELRPPRGYDFSSNDYLGYGARPFANVDSLPRGATASRLLRGHHPAWDIVENRLAGWHGAEAALVFNSGYVANEGLLSTAIAPGDWVASDQCNHASIIDGLRLTKAEKVIYPHNDVGFLEDRLREARQTSPSNRSLFVITEALFSMEGDVAPLVDIADVAEKHGAHLIVDEAHSTGCFGPQGSGLVDDFGLRGRVLATMHTGGKALGLVGAYVAGSRLLRDYLVNRCRHFIFTTALPPLVARWWLEAIDRVWHDDDGRRRLRALAAAFRGALAKRGVAVGGAHYIVPVPLGADAAAVRAAESLQKAGFDVRAIRPPTVPPGASRLRVSIHADHESATISELADRIASATSPLTSSHQ
jgi:8-amino-7-oxononanoate synthase